jgi:hypothetical protein
MTRYDTPARRAAGAAAVLVTAGLALTGCKVSMNASSPAAGSSSPASGSSSPAASGTSSAGAQTTAFFPVGVDNTWVYSTKAAGQQGGNLINKMTGVRPVADGQQVTMSVTAGTAAPATVTYVFHSDGSITVPMTRFGNKVVQLTLGSITWPSQSQLASGQPVTSPITYTVTVGGKVVRETAHVTVTGAGTQTVTVPAGTYQAQVINEAFAQNVGRLKVSFTLQTWVAKGVGPVKFALGHTGAGGSVPATVEQLTSFSRGQSPARGRPAQPPVGPKRSVLIRCASWPIRVSRLAAASTKPVAAVAVTSAGGSASLAAPAPPGRARAGWPGGCPARPGPGRTRRTRRRGSCRTTTRRARSW